jgi:hypothetical protein
MKQLFRSIQKKIRIAFDIIKKYGWKKFVLEIMPWLFHKRFIFYAGPVSGTFPESHSEIPFRLELAKEKDLHLIVRLRPSIYTFDQVQTRLKKGHFCFLGWSEDELIHCR